jgi:thiamine biosynthesis lipoprotein
MTLTRRRFLSISAALAVTPTFARAATWRGRAFGADISITLHGPHYETESALHAARAQILEIERLFSLYDPFSDLVKLNREGRLLHPDDRFLAVMRAADNAHRHTAGLFDPTVQPLWQALVLGGDMDAAKSHVGWSHVAFDDESIRLAAGQALTFNGIAQGFATDLVSEVLTAQGFGDLLVNIGEFRASGGPWHLGVSDPEHGMLATRQLMTGAIATSSPGATLIRGQGQILHSVAKPRWSTVSVEAETATTADAFSTAFTLADVPMIKDLVGREGIRRVTLVDFDGNLSTLS